MEGLQWLKSPVTKNKVFDPTKSKQVQGKPTWEKGTYPVQPIKKDKRHIPCPPERF